MQINYSGLTLLPSELTGEFTAASPELPNPEPRDYHKDDQCEEEVARIS